jgi:hypothetical protein
LKYSWDCIRLPQVAFLVFIAADNKRTDSARIFSEPGLLMYTTIGNILLFRLLWSSNAWLWTEYHINYNHLLNLGITQPNSLRLLEETSTFFMLYCIILIIYMELEVSDPGKAIHNVWPLLLLVLTVGFVFKSYISIVNQKGKVKESTGSLFDYATFQRCFSTPFIPVTFRDVFAADVLTSFTKPMSDGVYGACWLVSGSFLRNDKPGEAFGSSYIDCKGDAVTQFANVYIVCIPFLIRFLQCCRDGYDKQTWYPQALNALKYLSAMIFILYALANDKHSGIYYFLLVFTSLYKWWWDVVMDWDLFHYSDVPSDGYILLRSELLYTPSAQYYLAIVVDLILRFVWVVSLAPTETAISVLNTSQFNFFFGSLEITRRFVWAHFRMEYEHLKHVKKNAIGYIERRRCKPRKSHTAKTKKALIHRTKDILQSLDNDRSLEESSDHHACRAPNGSTTSASSSALESCHASTTIHSKSIPKDRYSRSYENGPEETKDIAESGE